MLVFHVLLCLLSKAITFLLTWLCGWWQMMARSSCLLGLGDSLAAFSLLQPIGKFGSSCLPAHPFPWAGPLLCLSFAPKDSDFPSSPLVLLFAMTDLPEMLGDFAICYLELGRHFSHMVKLSCGCKVLPPPPPSPAFFLRNHIIRLLTSLFPVLPESNMNYSSNPTCKWFKVEQLASKTCRMSVCVCKVWHRRMHLLAWTLSLYGKRQLHGN